jgi:autophagy-related protein 9
MLSGAVIQIYVLTDDIRVHTKCKQYYQERLGLSQTDLDIVPWDDVVNRITAVTSLNHADVMSIVMRQENYLIAMYNTKMIDGPVTETMEKVLWLHLFVVNWGAHGVLDTDLNTDEWVRQLKRRFQIFGIISIFLSPIICIGVLIGILLRYGEQIRENPSEILSKRRWSPCGYWTLREINEAPHLYDMRLRRACYHAKEYFNLVQPTTTNMIIMRTLMFMSGLVLLVLGLMTVFAEELTFQIGGLSSVFYITLLMATVSGTRSFLPNEELMTTPETKMREITQYTHHQPEKCPEFSQLFDYKVKIWLTEVYHVLILPYICLCIMPKYCPRFVLFLKRYTIWNPRVGNVCSCSLMEDMSNPHLKEGKYERSCLNFYINHPTWVIPEEIRSFLEKLRIWEQKQQVSPTINSGLFATDLNLMTRSAMAHNLYDSYRRQFKGGS